MDREKFINIIGLPTLYLLGWIMLFFLPNRFFYIRGDSSFEGWFVFFIVMIVLPFLVFQIFKRNEVSIQSAKTLAYGSVFFIIPFYFFIKNTSEAEMKIYKKETIGVVNKAWVLERRKRNSIWSVQVTYEIDGKNFLTSPKDDIDKILSFGDTVTIIYSSKTPEMSAIKELVEHYGK